MLHHYGCINDIVIFMLVWSKKKRERKDLDVFFSSVLIHHGYFLQLLKQSYYGKVNQVQVIGTQVSKCKLLYPSYACL